jgi:hypothetical protein
VVGVIMILVVVVALVARSGDTAGPVPGAAWTPPLFGFDAAHEADYTTRAAAGEAYLLYALSPGGVVATAQRVAAYTGLISRAAHGSVVTADTIEAMVFLESAGRSDVVAGADAASAAGLGQILAGTATGLLSMHVNLPASRRLTTAINLAAQRGDAAAVTRLTAARRSVDDRFVPALAIAGMVRYLAIADAILGRPDLAVESYHMGIGNVETAVRAYQPNTPGTVRSIVTRDGLSYARLYFDASPIRHAAAWRWLASLGDDSANYWWKVQAAAAIMRLWRSDRSALAALAARETQAASAELVLHPPGVDAFADPAAVHTAVTRGTLVRLAPSATDGYLITPLVGVIAARAGAGAADYAALRPAARATLIMISAAVRRISGSRQPLRVASTVIDDRTAAALRLDPPLRDTGYAFDIERRYAPGQAAAFQFVLDRLRALNLIAWTRTATVIHVMTAG